MLITVHWILWHGIIVRHYVFTFFSTPIQKFRNLIRLLFIYFSMYLLFSVCLSVCLSLYEFKQADWQLRAQSFQVSVLSWWRNSPPSIEFKSSLPCLTERATIGCMKQHDSSPHTVTVLTYFRSVLLSSSHLYLAVQRGVFPSRFPAKIVYPVLFCLYHIAHTSCPLFHPVIHRSVTNTSNTQKCHQYQ
jgi:hypothetical protein